MTQLRIGDTAMDIRLLVREGTLHADIANPSGYKVVLEWNGQTRIFEETQILLHL